MGQLIRIEKWAANLDEVTLSGWLAQPGDKLAAGEPLCEIITDKLTFEYEAPEGGILHRTYCSAGSTVPVGYIIAFLGQPDEALPDDVEERNAAVMRQYR